MSALSSMPVNIEQWQAEIGCYNKCFQDCVKQSYLSSLSQVWSKKDFVFVAFTVLYCYSFLFNDTFPFLLLVLFFSSKSMTLYFFGK